MATMMTAIVLGFTIRMLLPIAVLLALGTWLRRASDRRQA
jgi:hypothetical protein